MWLFSPPEPSKDDDADAVDPEATADTQHSSFGSSALNFLSGAVANASKLRHKLKEKVEDMPLIRDFNQEQNTFLATKHEQRTGEGVPPWVGYAQEDVLKAQILSLSADQRNFKTSPPSAAQFPFSLQAYFPCALATLECDPELSKRRFELVPKVVSEEAFWRNYFYRVNLIKQSSQLTESMRSSGSSAPGGGEGGAEEEGNSSADDTREGEGTGADTPLNDNNNDNSDNTTTLPLNEPLISDPTVDLDTDTGQDDLEFVSDNLEFAEFTSPDDSADPTASTDNVTTEAEPEQQQREEEEDEAGVVAVASVNARADSVEADIADAMGASLLDDTDAFLADQSSHIQLVDDADFEAELNALLDE